MKHAEEVERFGCGIHSRQNAPGEMVFDGTDKGSRFVRSAKNCVNELRTCCFAVRTRYTRQRNTLIRFLKKASRRTRHCLASMRHLQPRTLESADAGPVTNDR